MKESLEDAWNDFNENCINKQAGPDQRREMKTAFYAGALIVHSLIVEIGEPTVSEDEGCDRLASLGNEIQKFYEEELRQPWQQRN